MGRDLAGKNILITGANTGIGRATAVALGARGARLWLACRSEDRTRPVLDELTRAGVDVSFLPLDLGRLASVKRCAETFLAEDQPLHVLLNNAGLAAKAGTTADGFELTFGVNHLGHYLLTEWLLDRLRDSGPARIVNVASMAHYKARGIDFDALRTKTRSSTGLAEYQVSKLCNVLHAKTLAQRLEGSEVTTYSLHPGVIASDVWRHVVWPVRSIIRLFMKSNEEGAATSLHCAASPEAANETGLYYDECQVRQPSRWARDGALAERLDTQSREWVANYLPA